MIDDLLKAPPFGLDSAERDTQLRNALHVAYQHHFANCPAYRRFCEGRGLSSETTFASLADIPYLPVQAFKDSADLLRSVPEEEVRTTLQSSATSGLPSSVVIDGTTAKRQARALAGVLTATLGPKRRPLLVFDADPRSGRGVLGARSAAVQGFMNLGREVNFALQSNGGVMELDRELLRDLAAYWRAENEPVLLFGFTFLVYSLVLKPMLEAGETLPLPAGSHLAHLGGWKKLADQAVSKEQFARDAQAVFGIAPENVVDFYGFTEQMGVTYPDGPSGDKVVPAFAEVIVRDPETLEPAPDGESGLLQFLTPLPHSYPGIAVLTDDIGVITGRGESGGWAGTRFRVLGRAKQAEARGCGDILGDKVAAASARQATRPGDLRLLYSYEATPAVEARWNAPLAMETLPVVNPTELAEQLRIGRERLKQYSVDDLITLISAAAQRWADPASPLAELRQQGLLFLSSWCRPERLARLADEGLRGQRSFLDVPRPVGGNRLRMLGARHRGLVVHWLAGNVPVLGMLTLAQSILARNANLLKAASRFTRVLPLLLEGFRGLKVETPGGRTLLGDDVLASLAVVYCDREDRESMEVLSMLADVRLAWGGREAVETVSSLPKRYSADDIIFGPKLSFMVIGRTVLDRDRAFRRLARRAATDVCVFEQTGCASPHTIFVEEGGAFSPEEFAAALAEELDKALVRFPPPPIEPNDASRVVARRIRGELTGRVWRSKGTAWTVIFDGEGASSLAPPCYGRVITVRSIGRAEETLALIHDGIQTVGLALNGEQRLRYAREAARRGAERFPDIGRMTLFESPWDGVFPLDRLVKWYSLGGPV
ncbi:MAG: acyl-CoA reductase [Puniceicoccales bacterium]